MSEILNLKDLKVYYPIRSGFFNRVTDNVLAVDGVDLTIHELSLIHISEPTRP